VITAGQELRIPIVEGTGINVKVRGGGKGGKEQL
jgi:hypothetical protein